MKKTISRIFVGVMTAAMLIGASVLGVSAATATATQPCDGAHEGWTQFSVNSTTLAAGGTYYLAQDIDRTGALTISSNGTADNPAILCLNGHNIKATQATKPTYLVQFLNGTLKLCNCKDSGGNISGGTTTGVIVGSNKDNVCNLSVYDNVHFDGGTYSNATSGWHATPMQVNDYSTLTMYGGTISNNTCTATVGEATAVYVQGGNATFIMHDGTIHKNSGKNGGAVRNNNGTFTMTGGTISQNTASNVGGGVYSYIGTVTVSGSAEIKENSCSGGGGGICAEGAVTLKIEGNAAIQGNKAPSKSGGGIWAIGATINMTGGTISGNTAGNGGGIFLQGGTVTMTGGTISNNTGAAHNHGIHVGSGSFTMNDKTARIEEDDLGAVYSGGSGVFNLVEGSVSATGSRGALITNGKINVSGGQVYGYFEDGGDPERIVITGGKFSRDPSAYVGTSDKGAVIAVSNTGSDKNTYPYQVIISSHSHADDAQGTTWNYIAKAGQITVPGHYYLAGDIVSGQINIMPAASPVTLCLNGHNISSTDADFPLFAQGDIKLCNCSATSGNISGGKTRTVIFGGGTEATASKAEIHDNVHIDNGTLGSSSGHVGMVMVNPYSELTMYGGTVSNNKVTAGSLTSAVLLNGGVFNLVDGTISGNEVVNHGGGVLVSGENSVFNMSGGEISGNTANTISLGGGGVYVGEQGVFNLSGDGVIKENTVPNTNGGGVFVYNNGTFNMNGGKLIGNTATSTEGAGHGGAVCVHSKGHFLMSDGEITGSTQEKNTIVLLGSDNSAVVSGGAINGTLQNNEIKLTGGKFSFKPTVNHLGTNAGMLSIMSNTGADATVYPYVVGKGYNRVGEFMDFQSSLNLTITLGADVNFTADGVSATVNGQSVDPVEGDGFVTVPVSGIVAKAMDDVYTVVVTDGANTLYSEAVSVRELAGEWYADEAHSADKIMLADLINYGIAAQKEFERVATMTALPGAGTTDVPVWNKTEGAGVDAAYTDKVAVSLSLKDKIELNVYVRDEAATVAGVAGTAVTNEAGETVTRFTFDDIAVKDVKKPVAFAVTLSDGSVFNVKYSIADYVIQAQNGTQSDLIKALMKYVDSVSKYLAQ